MANAKKGRSILATVSADICVCGHRVDAHSSAEVCRYKSKSSGCNCTSIRTER